MNTGNKLEKSNISYWMFFRLIFVSFSLHLLGEAFYRWDGFKYYATFSEFLPSVALISILWSIIAVLVALIGWLLLRGFEWFCMHMGWKIKMELLVTFIGAFLLLVVLAWISKRIITKEPIVLFTKSIILICVLLGSIILTILFRNKPNFLHERITPLVWLFGMFVIISIPLVAYHTWFKKTDSLISSEFTQLPKLNENRPNIILITFDSLTTRNMSIYGYHKPTTPFISKWAKTASIFTRAEAESSFTPPTTASLMTGKRVWSHGRYHVMKESRAIKTDIESLPLQLRNHGYYNITLIVNRNATVATLGIAKDINIAVPMNELITSTTLLRNIDMYLLKLFGGKIRLYDWILQEDFILFRLMHKIFQDNSLTEYPVEKVFRIFTSILNDTIPKPFFAWVHLLPPHDPYLPPAPYMGMFDSSPELRTLKSQNEFMESPDIFKDELKPKLEILINRYDEFTRYCDERFGDLIEQLSKTNRFENTVVILSSDHGESFEHNVIGHGSPYLFEQETNIPLIIKEYNKTEGQIVNQLVEQIDIPATILDLAGIPVPSWMEGRSLVPLLRGREIPSKYAISMYLGDNPGRGSQITKGTIAVWEGTYKLIHFIENNNSFLFDLKNDPDELNNIFNEKPETGKHLLRIIETNLKKANDRIHSEKKYYR